MIKVDYVVDHSSCNGFHRGIILAPGDAALLRASPLKKNSLVYKDFKKQQRKKKQRKRTTQYHCQYWCSSKWRTQNCRDNGGCRNDGGETLARGRSPFAIAKPPRHYVCIYLVWELRYVDYVRGMRAAAATVVETGAASVLFCFVVHAMKLGILEQ